MYPNSPYKFEDATPCACTSVVMSAPRILLQNLTSTDLSSLSEISEQSSSISIVTFEAIPF